MLFAPPTMGTGDLVKGAPFSASGGWEAGLEGWVSDASLGGIAQRIDDFARTGDWCIAANALPWNGNNTLATAATYIIPAANCAGLRVKASVWRRNLIYNNDAGSSNTDTSGGLQVRINGDLFKSESTASTGGTTWHKVEIEYLHMQNLDLAIRLNSNRRVSTVGGSVVVYATCAFDDWSISTELP